ncbi:YrhK family protein [Curtobacterium flaccumfaciens]|nr:YrhK family protein [Curtobacterium flaccumfaciens]
MAQDERDIALRVGHEELRIRGLYETISIVNDVMVALWFIVGSVLFFSESTTTAGTWLFLIREHPAAHPPGHPAVAEAPPGSGRPREPLGVRADF